MKLLLTGLMFAALTVAVGCDRGSAGGPGTTATAKPPLMGQTDDTFNLITSSMSIKQGDTEAGTVGIKRGTNFNQDVTIGFADVPKGVSIDPSAPVLKSQATDAKFTLKAQDDATPGEYVIKVTGHPGTGGDAINQFKLTVGKKDTFTLSMPFWTTGLKQGEAKTVAISISRDKRFDQDVTLTFDKLPKGITIDPSHGVIKHGDTDTKVVLKAADDAPLGDFSVMVTGHPSKGADASHEFKFTIAKK